MSTPSESGETSQRPKRIITLRRVPRPSFPIPLNVSCGSAPLINQPQSASWNMVPPSSSTSTSTIIFLPSSFRPTVPSVNSNIVFSTSTASSNSEIPSECSAQFYPHYSHLLQEQLRDIRDSQQLEILNHQHSGTLDNSQGDMLSMEQVKTIYSQQGVILNTQQSESMYTQEGEVLYTQQGDAHNTQESEMLTQVLLQPHPIPEVKIEHRSLQPTCYICNQVFGLRKNMYRHMRVAHGAEQIITKKQLLICPLCQDTFDTGNKLHTHFLDHHGITIEKEFLELNSLLEFKDWKEKMERETKSFHRTYHTTRNGQKIIYVCNRMGVYVPQGKGERRRELKVNGSKRIGGTCPARITMEQTGDKVLVTFIKSHVGHELELRALNLTHSERRYLAVKMAQGFSKQVLLDKINETISPTMRMSYITMKDLHNIAQSVTAKTCMKLEADNTLSVDSFVQQLREKFDNNNLSVGYLTVDTSNIAEVPIANESNELPVASNDMHVSVAYEHVSGATDMDYVPADDNIDVRKQALVERFTNLISKCRSNDELDVIAKHLARIGPGLRAIKHPLLSPGEPMVRVTRSKLLPHERRHVDVGKVVKRRVKTQPFSQMIDINVYDTNLVSATLQYAT